MQRVAGHVFRVERKRGPVWYAKYRLPSGRQVQKLIGPAWTERGRPATGYFTKRTAEDWLRATLDEARRGTLPGMVRTGVKMSDAVAEWLRYSEHDRAVKQSTLTEYRLTADRIVRELGDIRIEDVTAEMLERWKATLKLSNRSVAKYLVILHGIFKRAMKVWGLPRNPVVDVERPRYRVSDDLDARAPGRTVARRGLRRRGDPRAPQLQHPRRARDAEERQGAVGPARPRCRSGARRPRPAGRFRRRRPAGVPQRARSLH